MPSIRSSPSCAPSARAAAVQPANHRLRVPYHICVRCTTSPQSPSPTSLPRASTTVRPPARTKYIPISATYPTSTQPSSSQPAVNLTNQHTYILPSYQCPRAAPHHIAPSAYLVRHHRQPLLQRSSTLRQLQRHIRVHQPIICAFPLPRANSANSRSAISRPPQPVQLAPTIHLIPPRSNPPNAIRSLPSTSPQFSILTPPARAHSAPHSSASICTRSPHASASPPHSASRAYPAIQLTQPPTAIPCFPPLPPLPT